MESLQVRLPDLKPKNFNSIPRLGFSITKNKLFYGPDQPELSFYETKIIEQEFGLDYFLPTSLELRIAQKKLNFEIYEGTITDSLVNFPSPFWRHYYSRMIRNPSLETREGIYPLLLEKTIIVEKNGDYFIEGGERPETLDDYL